MAKKKYKKDINFWKKCPFCEAEAKAEQKRIERRYIKHRRKNKND